MNVFDLFESPQLGAPSNGIGAQSTADQHSASPIGSGTTKREAKKKPVTMMGVAVKEDIEEGWFDTAAPKNEKWYLKKDGAVLRTVNGEPFTFKSKEDAIAWAKKTYKVSYDQQNILATSNPDKNLHREPRAQMEAGKKIKSNFKMPPESLQDKMYRQHQELRKQRGAPSAEEYKQRIAQKQAEIDALKESSYASDKNYKQADAYKNYNIYVGKNPFVKQSTGEKFYIAVTNIGKHEFKEKGVTQQEAVDAIQNKIDEILNAQQRVSASATLDFNVKFATDILGNPRESFYAKVINVGGEPKLIIAGKEMLDFGRELVGLGFKPSALRIDPESETATALPSISYSSRQIKDTGLIANGRYEIGDMKTDNDGNRVFDLTYHSTAHTKSDKMRLNKPAVTVGTTRSAEVNEGILDRAIPKMPKPRNPADQVLQTKVNAGGRHLDKKRRQELAPKHKHKDPMAEGEVLQFPKSPQDKNVRAKLEQRLLAAVNQIVDYADDNGIDILEKNASLYSKLFDKYDSEDATLDPEQAMARNEPIEVVAQVVKEVEHIAKHIDEYLDNMWGDTFNESSVDEGWKSAVAGAALAGSMALGGMAHAGEPVVGMGQSQNMQMAVDMAKHNAKVKYLKTVHGDNFQDKQMPEHRYGKLELKPNDKGGYIATVPLIVDNEVQESAADVKKKISKYEELALAANRAGDDAKCKQYQQKIQSLKQQMSQGMAEGWKSKLAGAALAGAAALGGGAAQAGDIEKSVGPLPVMATIVIQLPDGQTKTIKKDLGHSYDYKIDDAKKDIENLLDKKGIKRYSIHLDRYDSNAAYLDRDAMNSQAKDYSAKSDYVDRTPYQAKDTKTDYMDKTPYKSKPTTVNYVDKAKSGEFRDMANYESIEEMDRRGFLKALGGAALAGAGVNSADAQNIDLPGPQAVMIAHVQAEVNGREVNKTVNLGTQYQSKEQAEQDLEEYMQSKGITRYNIRVEQTYDRPGYIDSNQPRGGTATGREYGNPGLGDMIAGKVSREIRAGIPSKGGYATGGTNKGQRPRDGSQWWRDQLPQIMKEDTLEEDVERHLLLMRRAGYDIVQEAWSDKYKDSINCSNPKGFSQKAHCAGKKKNEGVAEARDGDTNFGSTVARGSWVVYNGSKVKRFKSRDGAKAYAAKNGGKVASSEFYADNIQKQGVAEEKVRLDPKCWTGKKIGNPKTKMKGGVRVNNCVPK